MNISLKVKDFSNWKRLYRALATFILYLGKLKARYEKRKLPTEVSFEMLRHARSVLYRKAQHSEFHEEIYHLKKGKIIEKNSKLISLDVFLDDKGVLKAKGRASFLNYEDVIILPTNHHVTFLMVRYEHETFHHMSSIILKINITYLSYEYSVKA